MSRCDYDTIFQRVFCVTLVAIALTFTVILTNVFVDIDGLLSSKDKLKTFDVPVPVLESEIHEVKVSNLLRPDALYKGERNYDEDNDENYRNKRSLETPNFLFHIKNPKIKNILTNRLSTLLEELDAEETVPENRITKEDNIKPVDKYKTKEDLNQDEFLAAINKAGSYRNELSEKKDEEDMLHLAMHNILLQGIIGHMDLNDVYKKVHSLVKNFKNAIDGEVPKETHVQDAEKLTDKDNSLNQKEYLYPKRPKEMKRIGIQFHNPSLEENKFFEEIVKCDKLQNDITNTVQSKNSIGAREKKMNAQKVPKLLIKTIIDITSNNKDKARKEINASSKETIKGIIKLIYNGKSVKFSRMEEEDNQLMKKNYEKISLPDEVTPKYINEKLNEETKDYDVPEQQNTIKNKQEHTKTSNAYFNKIIDDYFKKYPKKIDDAVDDRYNEKIEPKRLKRHIKIKYDDDDETTTLSPKLINNRNDDDELFVEIETHFDSKGMKGEKKKKLIRSIIEKIQKAIHSDIDNFNHGKKKKHKHVQVKKRIQNPLEKDQKLLINKIMLPFDTLEQRYSDPISKAVALQNPLPGVTDKSGENWKKTNFGPGFLAMSKSLNSAEMGEVEVDYNKVMPANGIPQRLQKPLNTDVSEEMLNANTYFDLGNLKFFIKNIDGTGLSIGFNQYTDEAPDPDSIKLFTGIEHLVKTYHHNEGPDGTPAVSQGTKTSASDEKEHQISKRDVIGNTNEHVMIRRSIKETREKDYHSNEYKIIFDNNFLPYNNYQEIYEDKKKRVAVTINKETENINSYDRGSDNLRIIRKNVQINESPVLMDENNNIFYKKLKPSEILSIASLLDRKKRSINIQKINNVNKKMKLNRYLNTRSMGRKKIILNKKRSKRQIDKIRIIARDGFSRPRHSEDNIFLVNDENLLADRAILREVETPEVIDVDDKIGEQYEMVPVMDPEDPSYDPTYGAHEFDGRSRQNQLMSKYPHIFTDEIIKSREEYDPTVFNKYEIKASNPHVPEYTYNSVTTEKTSTMTDISMTKLEDIVKAIDPKTNYKFTVKILPKNMSDVNGGFKEIHASINKSFNRDGLKYSSLVNVSEISRVENLHKMTEPTLSAFPTQSTFIKHIQEQQNRMNMLLKQHKMRIDEQLDHLKKERLRLDTITAKTDEEKVIEKIEITSLKPEPLVQMSNDDVSKLLASALFQLQSQNEFSSTIITSTSTTTAKPTIQVPITVPKPEIDRNDKINNEILNQINRNTAMLQTFLQKLTDKLTKEREPIQRNSEDPPKFDYVPRYWKQFQDGSEMYQPPFDPKNDTHLPVPLVYAYQPPFSMNNFKNPVQHIPIASVVYHGHIHTDSLGKLKNSLKGKEIRTELKAANDKNQTKYFIDAMEHFKVLPVKKKSLPDEAVPSTTERV